MAKAVKARPTTAWPYTLRGDLALPIEQQSRFLLRPVTGAERDAFRDSYLRFHQVGEVSQTATLGAYTQARKLCVTHIQAIENFPSDAPKAWPADPDARTAYLELLDDEQIRELGNEIWTASTLTEAERSRAGESSPPSDTSESDATKAASSSTTASNASAAPV